MEENGGSDFFSSKKKGAATFFHRKKRGRELFFKRKKGGAEFFTRGKIPKTRPRYPVNFGRSLRELAKFIGNGAGQPEFSTLKKSLCPVISKTEKTLRPVIF